MRLKELLAVNETLSTACLPNIINKNAYGLHDWEHFRLKILRGCGKPGESTDRD